jgi:hypothetical protein
MQERKPATAAGHAQQLLSGVSVSNTKPQGAAAKLGPGNRPNGRCRLRSF